MTIVKQAAPDESLREYVEFKDGLLYWRDLPENKSRLRKCNGKHIGSGRRRVTSYAQLRFNGERYAVHRVVYWLNTGEWPEIVDHKDRDRQNNRFDNLRAATTQSNTINSKLKKACYGIQSNKLKNGKIRFYPRIWIEGKSLSFGPYDDEATALCAAWKMRDLLYPGFCPVPEKLRTALDSGEFTPHKPTEADYIDGAIRIYEELSAYEGAEA